MKRIIEFTYYCIDTSFIHSIIIFNILKVYHHHCIHHNHSGRQVDDSIILFIIIIIPVTNKEQRQKKRVLHFVRSGSTTCLRSPNLSL
mmetsp:Transcript_35252/g.40086  ORF Transcript_35252/g.40086 Transcript_35252/m.40086 type:complete len:88 (-) Transcript_35252:91-354(-)